jgi:CheY-like chemotaxis protein
VLVVDDEPAICVLIRVLLEAQGYEVRTAPDGAAALAAVRAAPPDLIFLDRQLPRVSGPAFAAAYRALPAPHAPIVAMSAGDDAARYAAEIGAAGCLPKPFRVAQLHAYAARYARRPAA